MEFRKKAANLQENTHAEVNFNKVTARTRLESSFCIGVMQDLRHRFYYLR